MVSFNDLDQLAMVNNMHWCGHMLIREHGHIIRRVEVGVYTRKLITKKDTEKASWEGMHQVLLEQE